MQDQIYENFFYSAADGLKLHARIYGKANDAALPVICLAGLTRNAADFHELAVTLSSDATRPRQVIAFDYRGRGRSAYDTNWKNYDPIVEAGDVLAGLAALNVPHGAFIGTSRGGLIIMILSAMRSAVLKAAILNDIGPVVQAEGLMMIRAYLERAPKPSSFADAIAIQQRVNGEAFSALSPADWERMIRAIYRNENGVPVPDFDPALLNTLTSVDLDKPLPELWPQFAGLADIPVMAIRGANSKLLSAATLDEMAKRHQRLTKITVQGQGHAPLLETGDLPQRISRFLADADKTV